VIDNEFRIRQRELKLEDSKKAKERGIDVRF